MGIRKELIRYLFVGGATTFVNWIVYALMVRFAGLPMIVGNITAWVISVIFAFFTNKLWVFKSRCWHPLLVLREGSAFLAARILSGLVDITGVPFLFHLGLDYPLLGIEGFAAKVTVSVIVVVSNYLFSKLFIFRESKG